MSILKYPQIDLSGGVQKVTSFLLGKPNQIEDIRNGRFGIEIGSIVRRGGCERVGNNFNLNSSDKAPSGGYIAKFTTGNVRMVACLAADGLSTVVRSQNSGTGAWTTLITGLPANAVVNFFMWLDEVYVSGYDPATNTPFATQNINAALNVSTTRNVLNMPACKYVQEFNGSLYACNVVIDSVLHPDRAYKSSGPLGFATTIRGAQGSNSASGDISVYVDSVRYLKAGMAIDVYAAGTETKTQDLTITAVDKNLNSFSVALPATDTVSAVTAATDLFTIASTAAYATGTPVVITASTTMPAPLVAGTTYYAIIVSGTTFKLATSYANAIAGTAIDITSAGAGTIAARRGIYFNDNDEIWLDGRKGSLTVMWNTDYPTPETSDWTATQPGTDSSNAITGVAKSSGRLFLFTKNSGQKFDGRNTKTFNNSVGCVAAGAIRNLDDDWIVWLDANGRVWARNESTGQQEYISRGINKSIMRYLTQTNLAAATANVFDNQIYIYIGAVDVGNGTETLRIVYNFDDNTWAIDRLPMKPLFAANDDYTGVFKPYFFADDGYLYIDETGNTDNGAVIPLEISLGRSNLGTERQKKYVGVFIYSEGMQGAEVKLRPGQGEIKDVGQIESDECYVEFPTSGDNAVDICTSAEPYIYYSAEGDAPIFRGLIWYASTEEDYPNARRPQV